jgi:penicillin-binding protein A
MFVTRRSPRRRIVLIGAGAAVAGALFLSTGSDGAKPGTPAARIGGAALVPVADVRPAAPPPPTLPAALELDRMTLDEERGRYVLALTDGRQAELTLDPVLQRLAERLLNQSRAPRGAIVAMTPDGRVLALAGRHTDEPKGSTRGTFDWRHATDVWAPSASIFKLVTATALVKAGVTPDGRICYHGGIRSVMESNLRDHERDSRCEDLNYGVAHSNNAILGKLAFQHLEPRTLAAQADTLGWTGRLPASLAVPGSIGELVVPPARDLDFAKTAAGFWSETGGARLSVMGGALVASVFAAEGRMPAARLVAAIDGVEIPAVGARQVVAPDTARAIAKMMAQTCANGSAGRVFRGQQVAGKTGTLTRREPVHIEHSWFVGFAPLERPEIVVSVLLGNAESWHLRGHEAARRMIDRALRRDDASAREKDRKQPRRKR